MSCGSPPYISGGGLKPRPTLVTVVLEPTLLLLRASSEGVETSVSSSVSSLFLFHILNAVVGPQDTFVPYLMAISGRLLHPNSIFEFRMLSSVSLPILTASVTCLFRAEVWEEPILNFQSLGVSFPSCFSLECCQKTEFGWFLVGSPYIFLLKLYMCSYILSQADLLVSPM